MEALDQLAEALKSKGCDIEINDIEDSLYKKQIGIRYPKQHTYHWFQVWNDDKGQAHFSFQQSYSQITGTTKKSFNAGYRVYLEVKRLTGIAIY